MFDIPVRKGFVTGNSQQIHDLWNLLGDIWNECDRGEWSGESGRSTGQQLLDLHAYPEMDWIIQEMMPDVIDFWDNDLKYASANIQPTASWANLHEDGDTTAEHSHSDGKRQAHVASVFYLKKSPDGGHIEFCDPLDYVKRHTPLATCAGDAILSESMPASTADFILFPGWLRHRTQPAVGKRVAISINFNGY